jgi:predicted RNase H-like nuclease
VLRPLIDDAGLALIDMPIGLVTNGRAERVCDRAARALLGRPRASSVFRPPCRGALGAQSYGLACELNRQHTGVAMSMQTWNIAAKIRELDDALAVDPTLADRLREAHPELCLWGLSAGRAMAHNKRTLQGRSERLQLLRTLDPACLHHVEAMARTHPRRALGHDDIVDATVLALTAAAALRNPGCRRRLPAASERDDHGLPMELLYVQL